MISYIGKVYLTKHHTPNYYIVSLLRKFLTMLNISHKLADGQNETDCSIWTDSCICSLFACPPAFVGVVHPRKASPDLNWPLKAKKRISGDFLPAYNYNLKTLRAAGESSWPDLSRRYLNKSPAPGAIGEPGFFIYYWGKSRHCFWFNTKGGMQNE